MNPNFKKIKDLTVHVQLTTSLLLLNISYSKCWWDEGFWEKMGKEEIRVVIITSVLKLVTAICDNFCNLTF